MNLPYLVYAKQVSDYLHEKHKTQDPDFIKMYPDFPRNGCQLSSRLLLKVLENVPYDETTSMADHYQVQELAGYHSTYAEEGDGWHCWLHVKRDNIYLDLTAHQFRCALKRTDQPITSQEKVSVKLPQTHYDPSFVVIPKEDTIARVLYSECERETESAQRSIASRFIGTYLEDLLLNLN